MSAGPLVVTYPLTRRSRAIVAEELGGTAEAIYLVDLARNRPDTERDIRGYDGMHEGKPIRGQRMPGDMTIAMRSATASGAVARRGANAADSADKA